MYTGYYFMKYAMDYNEDEDALTSLINDYCDTYYTNTGDRTNFILFLEDLDSDTFIDECETYINDGQIANLWYDPIDPLTTITTSEICDLHEKLFESLRSKGLDSLAEEVSFSYLTSLDLYFETL
jgi:hypothetical protein